MAESKYSDLPGIAYDQPDVYETDDLPEADQNVDNAEEDSDSIDRPQLCVEAAFGKFKGKALVSDRVDFSDRLSKTLRTGYDARTCEWELVGQGEKETPLQKYQRLQCEMSELLEEVGQLKSSVKDEEGAGGAALAASHVQRLLQQLREMRLEEQLGSELVTSLADPQGAGLRKLLAQLDAADAKPPATKPGTKPGAKTEEGQSGQVIYELMFRPEQARLAQTSRLAHLEQRLHALEGTVGDAPTKLSRVSADTRHLSLSAAVQLLSTKAGLLDSAQLDHIEGRLTALGSKMDQIAEQSVPKEEAEHDKKISELYELAVKCESLSGVLPEVTERLAAAHNLHEQALQFSKALAQLDALQEEISAALNGNATLLKDVNASFTQNKDTIKQNISSLETRIAALTKK